MTANPMNLGQRRTEPDAREPRGSPARRGSGRLIPASDWHSALRARHAEEEPIGRARFPFEAAGFRATPQAIAQPALTDDVFCLHRGGAKRVHRLRDGRRTVHDVPLGALTVMPRHRAADWLTEGPIDYVHITLSPKSFEALLESECDTPRGRIDFRDDVGFTNPLLAGLAEEMLRVAAAGDECRLYVDTLFTAFSLALVRHCSDAGSPPSLFEGSSSFLGGLAGWRLRRIVDFMKANLSQEVTLEELMVVSGLSRAHLFRAFRQSTGTTPGRYLERLRVEQVRRSVERGDAFPEAASNAGFNSRAAMSRAFRRVLNITPEDYRRWYR